MKIIQCPETGEFIDADTACIGCPQSYHCRPESYSEVEILCCSDGYYHHRTPIRNDEKLSVSCDMPHFLPLSRAAFIPSDLENYVTR